ADGAPALGGPPPAADGAPALGGPPPAADGTPLTMRMPPALGDALSGARAPVAPTAQLNGQVAMELVVRNERGAVMGRRHGLAVSEPRLSGSSAGRMSWNESVSLGALG
ncbi:hypothetical protein, partial [uncultured Thiodictyon sp.]|uniref:hypothetical protein n=1 Tax=uncultured Thiodictyon sp. TaxID=1846217 RepID=UPI0025D82EC9